MTTKTAPKKAEDAAILHWRDHPAVRAAEEHLAEGERALAAAAERVTALEREVEALRARMHEVAVAAALGESTTRAAEQARTAAEQAARQLAEAQDIADAQRGALEVLRRRRDAAVERARVEVRRALDAQYAEAVTALAGALRTLEQCNREVLRLMAYYRANGFRPPAAAAWPEALHLRPGEPLIGGRAWMYDGRPIGKTLLTAWFEAMRAAGFAVEPPEPASVAEIVGARFAG